MSETKKSEQEASEQAEQVKAEKQQGGRDQAQGHDQEQLNREQQEREQEERAAHLKTHEDAEANPLIEEGGPLREDVEGDQEVQDNAHDPDPEDDLGEHADPEHTQEREQNEEAMREQQKQGDEVPNPALTEKGKGK